MRPDASEKLAATAPKKGPNKGIIALVVVLVIALIAGGAYLLTNNKSDSSGSATPPKNGLANGKGLTVDADKAKAGAKTVDIYEDFQCPICKDMEASTGAAWQKLAADGTIKLNYHVLSFLDDNLRNDSSKRAANAAFCAADQNKFLEFHNKIFPQQPKEGVGYTDDKLKSFGKEAGLSGAAYSTFTSCVDSGTYKKYVTVTNDRMGPDNVTGTPTVKINGKAISGDETTALVMGQTSPTDVLAKY